MKNLFSTFLLLFSLNSFAQVGLPDVNFGINGITTIDLSPDDELFDMKILPDGKILCLSKSEESGGSSLYPFVCRLNPDGSLDPSYGTNGATQLPDQVFLTNYDFNLAIDDQQRAVVAVSAGSDIIVYRLTASGSLDTDFSFDGKVTVDFGNGDNVIAGLGIQSDGKIVLACTIAFDFAIARLNSSGTFDTSFGNNGKQTYNVTAIDRASDIAIQADNKILVCGATDDGFGNWAGIIRVNNDGTLDNTFDGDGKVTRIINNIDTPYGIEIGSDGKIIVVGHTRVSSFVHDGFVLRYNSDGTEDNTFDTDGLFQVNMSGATDFFTVAAIQPDGKILTGGIYDALGSNGTQAWSTRLNVDGTLDTDFSTDGSTNVMLTSTDLYVQAAELTPSGDLILGARDAGSTHNFYLIKLKTGLNIGVDELESRTILAYPNPTTDLIYLNLKEFNQSDKSIRIFNSEGRLVFESFTTSNTFQIDLQTLSSGIYSCLIVSESEKSSFQFIKN